MQNKETFAPAAASPQPLVLDIRASFAQGISPCSAIDQAVASLAPGQTFVLLAPFEPVPLFGKLGAQGLRHHSAPQADGSWRIEFARTGAAPLPGAGEGTCCGH